MSEARHNCRYHMTIIALHWLTLFLLVAVYALMEFKGIYEKGSAPREFDEDMALYAGFVGAACYCDALGGTNAFDTPTISPAPPFGN